MDNKLQEMASKMTSQPGYQDFMTMPLMSKLVKNIVSNDGQTPTSTGKLQADPSFTKIGASNRQRDIKKKESQADIMAKIFNLMQEQYTYNETRTKESKSYQKKVTEQKEKFFLETLNVINDTTGKSLKPGKMARVAKTSKATGYGVLGFGLKTAAVVGGLFVAESALANVDWKKEFSSITDMKDLDVSGLPGKIQSMLGEASSKPSEDPRKAIESYINRPISDDEFDQLIRATSAEAGVKSNKTEQAMIMATILNRSRDTGKTITETLHQKNQFQAVTGTAANNNQPSQNYLKGPSTERKDDILSSTSMLSGVDKNQKRFTAADRNAYKAGTDSSYLDKLQSTGGDVVGGTQFETKAPTSMSPTLSSLKNSNVSSGYGNRAAPLPGAYTDHKGIDIKGNTGDPVKAVKAGKIKFAGEQKGYGKLVVIDHGDGTETKYGHLSDIGVTQGAQVESNQIIGKLGATGNVTGPHLHYELIKNGQAVDPKSDSSFYVDPIERQITQLYSSGKKPKSSQTTTISSVNNNIKSGDTIIMSQEPTQLYPAALSKQFGYNAA